MARARQQARRVVRGTLVHAVLERLLDLPAEQRTLVRASSAGRAGA